MGKNYPQSKYLSLLHSLLNSIHYLRPFLRSQQCHLCIFASTQIVRVSGPEAYQVLNLLRPTPPLQKMSRDELISKYSLKPK